MASLTPLSRSDEVTSAACYDGFISGLLTLVPTCGALYVAMQNPGFVKRTNWSSRTAMAIMPALFVFGYTAEHKLNHRMREMAKESEHANDTVDWAERELVQAKLQHRLTQPADAPQFDATKHLTTLYQQSVANSGICIVPGDHLGVHHRAANYAAENPFKVLAAFAVPAVSAIFWGRSGKGHLELSMKILHTRVFGQFATISLLLTVMGFKAFMNQNGKFITQAEADERVQEMHQVRMALVERLQIENELQASAKREIRQARQQDLRDRKKKQQQQISSSQPVH